MLVVSPWIAMERQLSLPSTIVLPLSVSLCVWKGGEMKREEGIVKSGQRLLMQGLISQHVIVEAKSAKAEYVSNSPNHNSQNLTQTIITIMTNTMTNIQRANCHLALHLLNTNIPNPIRLTTITPPKPAPA